MMFSHGARMTFDRFSRLASIPALVFCLLAYAATAVQAASITLLRDADVEQALNRLAAPVLQAAGLNARRTKILVVNESSYNAFVLDNRTIFVHYGLILKSDSPEMLQAVLAHEAAHIANGHLARRMQNMRSAGSAAGLGMALAVLAAAAGAGSEASTGIAIGTQSSALRGFLSHTRAEESSADRSAAGYLSRAGVNPQGLVDLHQTFAGQEVLSAQHQDPYMRSHPLSRDRIRAAQAYVASHGTDIATDPEAEYWFARLRGKLSAFVRSPKWTLRRAGSESHKDVRLMREAIAYHRLNNRKKALTAINGAISLRPKDPFYHDLKGQILMENRDWNAALSSYGQAVALAPSDPLVLASYGRAQLAAGQPRAALKSLEKSRGIDFRNTVLLRDMAQAYAKTKQTGLAALVTAERYALQGRLDDAGLHAKRATALLPTGSPAWRRAQDVLVAYEKTQKRKRK
ncbi:M48 family metalloprotease [Phaeobacter gallaeciensis]|uniref:M48 family metalloprotease n=1 Tax=Phaeobacter gallaeciensis TaxID=60890 RepID=UPI00237F14F1|nr:M48 family metalloprotease [Phaeobacter gallaeciensis]MDE4304159.1 M48 family metalloprotease [Phaeobacter gallaeciensis]MDE4308498.1 M48 family metalloprotease [Phaeobacter gallaeciensis]MDE4312955.1 M48 family metalloprotease [Phaeobacter gallaeciensis]MDE4317090.1 M48 family metalloprotease [Phaeobacter gallaeciensis]MDE4321553.1 M48 family metalloprotease [Phaeobacter gallaeciensis]